MGDTLRKDLFGEDFLKRVQQEDLEALCHLDQAGILCGAEETGKDLTQRLRCFKRNVGRLEEELARTGHADCEGLALSNKERIGKDRFRDVAGKTESLYGFSIDWVPGFYVNPSGGMLFGGCAFCQYPDFFTLFIIRRSFRRKTRWLIYNREELLSHELCHVARMGMESVRYEESFAYQTSSSAFRRLLGGMFYRQSDSFLFLGVTLLLLIVQIVRTFALHWIPIWPFWLLMGVVFGGLFLRQGLGNRRMGRALKQLKSVFGEARGWPVLFRCTDEEIEELSRLKPSRLEGWLQNKSKALLRWRIIQARFGATGETTA